MLPIGDPAYPTLLREISAPPTLLYVLGDGQLSEPSVAIVGTRTPTIYGRSVAGELARSLAVRGFSIVSGMARGIDTAAHGGALQSTGQSPTEILTVAVLGSGADVVYPRENRELHQRIRRHGAVVSEFPMGSHPERGWFPRRNRVISGLSLGVVLVEAPSRSGALITARCAGEQNREVFAVPGDIRNGRSAGCHALIKDGAKLTESVEDVVEELSHRVGPADHQPASNQELALSSGQRQLLNLLEAEPCHIDALARQAHRSADRLLGDLLRLELAGLVAQLPGKYFSRLLFDQAFSQG